MKLTHFFAFLAIVSLPSCSYISGKRIKGNGNLVTEEKKLNGYTGIESNGSFDVYISPGPQSVKVEAEENLQPYIEVDIHGDNLRISAKSGYSLEEYKPIKIYVSNEQFHTISTHGSGNITSDEEINGGENTALEVAGSGNINIKLKTSKASAEITGSGNINISGEADELKGRILGSGDIKAAELFTSNSSIKITGSGDAQVNVKDKLTVHIAGSGDVKYKGTPKIESNIAGSGSVSSF